MTMKKAVIFTMVALALGACGGAQARGMNDVYGDANGNSYNTYGNGYQGYNSNTGSQWSSNTHGSTTTGIDSKGNQWSYDRDSGTYQNYGTGETRYRGQRQ
jgi:hypothetical protein